MPFRPSCRARGVRGGGTCRCGAERWQMQYFYDKSESSLEIGDLQFASATRGVAVGIIDQEESPPARRRGHRRWRRPLGSGATPGAPVSLFFLNENLGWLVTAKGIWQTTEAGRSWHKLPKSPEGVLRVYFLDAQNGFAVGIRKMAMATHDGGEHWTPLPEAATPPGDPSTPPIPGSSSPCRAWA